MSGRDCECVCVHVCMPTCMSVCMCIGLDAGGLKGLVLSGLTLNCTIEL